MKVFLIEEGRLNLSEVSVFYDVLILIICFF